MEEKEKLESGQGNGSDSQASTQVEESAEELKAKLNNVVEELTKERQQKGVYKELYEKEKETKTETPEAKAPVNEDEVTKKVKEILAQEKASEAQVNKKTAFEKFVADHKEFHPGNDVTGIKRQALEQKVNAFNTSGLTKIEEFYTVIRDAYKLLGGSDTTPESSKEIRNPYSDTPIVNITPKSPDDTDVTASEKALYEGAGWTKEKFLKIKAKNPEMIDQLSNKDY